MSSTTHSKRLGAALTAVAAVAALAAPSILAGQPQQPKNTVGSTVDYSLDPWLKNAIAAHQRQVRLSVQPASGTLGRHFQHEDRIFRGLDDRSAATPTVATVQSNGFDWSSFGIGIGTGIGALLILVAVASRVGKVRHLVNA